MPFPGAPAPTPAPTAPEAPRGDGIRWLVAAALGVVLGIGCLGGALYPLSAWGALALALSVAVVAMLLSAPPRLGPPAWLALGAVAALALLAAASMLWAPSVDRAWTEANRAAFYALVLLATLLCAGHPARRRLLFALAAATCAAVPGSVVIDALAGSAADLFVDFRLYHPVGYTNGMAALLLIAVWLFVAVAATDDRAFAAAAAMGVAACAGSLLVLTQSRAIVPAVLVSAAAGLLVARRRTRLAWALLVVLAAAVAACVWTLDVYAGRFPQGTPAEATVRRAVLGALATALAAAAVWGAAVRFASARLRRAATVAAVLIPLAGVAAALLAVEDPVGRVEAQYRAFTQLQVQEEGSNRFTEGGGYRYDLWRIAWNEFTDHPLGGIGAGNYGAGYLLQRRNPQYVRQPHSIEMQVLAELGLAGLLALLAAAAGLVWGMVVARRREGGSALLVGAAGALAAWAAHTSVDWLHNLPSVTALVLVLGGLVLARTGDGGRRGPGAGGRRALAVVLVAATALGAASIGRQYVADRYRDRAEGLVRSDPRAAIRAADRALAFNPEAPEIYYARAAAAARLDLYPSARETLLVAAEKEPFNYVPWALLGDLAVRRGDLARARRDYGRASALNPFDPGLRELAADPARAGG